VSALRALPTGRDAGLLRISTHGAAPTGERDDYVLEAPFDCQTLLETVRAALPAGARLETTTTASRRDRAAGRGPARRSARLAAAAR